MPQIMNTQTVTYSLNEDKNILCVRKCCFAYLQQKKNKY